MFLSIVALIAGLKSKEPYDALEGLAYMLGYASILEIVIELFAITTYLGINI